MDIEGRLRRFIADELQVGEDLLSPDFPLIANRLVDSLGLLQIVSFVESEFEVEILDDELVQDNFGTIRAIGNVVSSKLAERAS